MRRTTSGACVPGEACAAEPLFLVPFPWANTFENAPKPRSARKRPVRKTNRPIKMRGLKKADLELSFFFIGIFLSVFSDEDRILPERASGCHAFFPSFLSGNRQSRSRGIQV